MRTQSNTGRRIVLRGGTVVDGVADAPYAADVLIKGNRIQEIGRIAAQADDEEVDCAGQLILPGFIDAHSHADAMVFDEPTQLSLLRQGITTVITGQDGVSFAPGSGEYAASYFAAINGSHPSYNGGGVGQLLDTYNRAVPLNVAYLVPAGTVRWEVMGAHTGSPTPEQLAAMTEMVSLAMDEGAVGLSSGLDYVPGIFADAQELAALCKPVAAAGSVYVTHMRGGYEANSREGIEEISTICAPSGVKAHIAHFHAEAPIIAAMLDELEADGVDTTFDAYPYAKGCSLLSMPLLPPELSVQPVETVLEALGTASQRENIIRNWFPVVAQKPSLGPDWPEMITLAHIASPEYAWAHGLTLAQAASEASTSPAEFALDVMLASRLEVNAVMAVRYERSIQELGTIMSSPKHVGGSDGIFIGAHPHPRAAGSYPKFLRCLVREGSSWSWPDAVRHLSTTAAERFGLGLRGRVQPGYVADLLVVDPDTVQDTATYQDPTSLAAGISTVLVDGIPVLSKGELTGARPGQGLRRAAN